MKTRTSKPRFVQINDIHFNLKTNPVAGAALLLALQKAEELNVPLFIDGDLNDTKAMLRAECVYNIISILAEAKVPVFIIIGNHDLINHHDSLHSLEFLRPYATIIQEPVYVQELKAYVVPYQHDLMKLREYLADLKARGAYGPSDLLLMHQGIRGAFMGEYTVDKTSIDPAELAEFAVISGHYHRRQTIFTDGKKHADYFGVGTFNFTGSPYTITFAEANDGPKGFSIVNEDRSITLVETNLRKHVIIEKTLQDLYVSTDKLWQPNDIIWLKISGPSVELDKLKKKEIGMQLFGHTNFKLDKIPTDSKQPGMDVSKLTREQIVDKVIDESSETAEQKKYLKTLWRELLI